VGGWRGDRKEALLWIGRLPPRAGSGVAPPLAGRVPSLGWGALGSLLGFESRKRKPIRQSIEEEDDGAGIGWIDWR